MDKSKPVIRPICYVGTVAGTVAGTNAHVELPWKTY
jgi:hypothetical protein